MQLCTARRNDGRPVIDITGLKTVSIEVEEDIDEVKELFQCCVHLTNFAQYVEFFFFT